MPERASSEIPSWLRQAALNLEELAVDDGSPAVWRHRAENDRLEKLVDEAGHRIAQLRLSNLQDSLSDVEDVITGLQREADLRRRQLHREARRGQSIGHRAAPARPLLRRPCASRMLDRSNWRKARRQWWRR